MGYKDNKLGYPGDLLASRAVVKKGNYALIPAHGLVKNVIPGFDNCNITILSSPKLGASFVDYIVELEENGKNDTGFGGDGVETFMYVIDGKVEAKSGEEPFILNKGGYLYCPPDKKMFIKNIQINKSQIFLYKRKYKAVVSCKPYTVSNHVADIEHIFYEGMDNVTICDLLPKEIAFDMNFHILSFKPGASHGYIETHVQEHGAYILSGQGMYNLDNQWMPVKKGDYIFMGAYALQAAYGVGKDEDFAYIYSKDCHRDEDL